MHNVSRYYRPLRTYSYANIVYLTVFILLFFFSMGEMAHAKCWSSEVYELGATTSPKTSKVLEIIKDRVNSCTATLQFDKVTVTGISSDILVCTANRGDILQVRVITQCCDQPSICSPDDTKIEFTSAVPKKSNLVPNTCASLQSQISEIINKHSYCEHNKDCTVVTLGCPYGCETPINRKAELEELQNLYLKYANNAACNRCLYSCSPTPFPPVKCIEEKCSYEH